MTETNERKLPVIYISGKFRGKSSWEVEQNIRLAEELSLQVWLRGAVALCPHMNTRYFQGAAPDEVWLKGDLELVLRSDALLMVPNWRTSVGARMELEYATKFGIPIYYSLEEMEKAELLIPIRGGA